MAEGLRLFFGPGAGAILFSQFVLLYILPGLSGFAAMGLLAVVILATFTFRSQSSRTRFGLAKLLMTFHRFRFNVITFVTTLSFHRPA